MVIPKGKVVHEDLSTSYTNIHELLRDLRQNSFTGYCLVNFWEYRGTLFLDRGRIINACEEMGSEQSIGDRAIKNILNRASQKDGTVSVFQLPDEMVATLASVLNSKVKYKDLTTELTSLEKLISKLKKEEHSGYVEVLLNSDSGDGCIYFQDGRAMESVFRAADGEMISGPSGFKKILGLSTEVGAVIDGAINGVALGLVPRLTRLAGRVQSGYLFHYAFAMVIGIVVLMFWVVLTGGSH